MGEWLSACETRVQGARTWKILKTFGNLSLVQLLRRSQEVARCPLLLPVNPSSLGSVQLSDQNVMHFLWSFRLLRFPGLGVLCKKGELNHGLPVQECFLQGPLLCHQQKQAAEDRRLVSPYWGVFLSSWCPVAVFYSCHPNSHLYKHSVHLRGCSSKEELMKSSFLK